MQTQPAASESDALEPDALIRALDDIARRIGGTYPTAVPERIASVLRARYERTRDAKVQQYRLVLAERDTRLQLRLDERSATPIEMTSAPAPTQRGRAAAARYQVATAAG